MIPRQTMLIDIYIAALTEEPAQGRVEHLLALPEVLPAQKILAENGYRPVDKQALTEAGSKFPVRPGETKITSPLLGGWRAVDKKWFDPNKSIMQKIEKSLGVSNWLARSPRRRASRRPPPTAGRGPRRPSPCRSGFVTSVPADHRRAADRGGRLEVDR